MNWSCIWGWGLIAGETETLRWERAAPYSLGSSVCRGQSWAVSNQQGLIVYDACLDLGSHLDLNSLEPGWVTAGTRKSAWGPSQAELPV